ncbi:hypothetical protein FNAPI_9291 [Fusarium napiforme]|uniref:Uncharacterized protein n=1 Tax=Fusarium napiforme TaxID=42672 RepID=A0A8H5MXU0_9HYPO|nr:hypothetical protein FNAPI_9291 [Fusarium napiforme]
MADKKNNIGERKRSATTATLTIPVIQGSSPARPVDKSGEKAAKKVKTTEIETVESKAEHKRDKLLAATSTRRKCVYGGIVNIISIGTSYMAVLYNIAGPAVAILLRLLSRIGRLANQPAKQE